MYRDILSKPIELTESVLECKCDVCGSIEFVPETCELLGHRYGNGHETGCPECKGGTLKEVTEK